MSALESHDQVLHFWCPMLGQTMLFGYCRKMQGGLPCHRVLVCFGPHFDVQGFLNEHFTPQQQEQFLAAPKSRLERILDAADQARQKQDQGQ